MKVTEIRLTLADDESTQRARLLAFCSITFDGVLAVHEAKVINGKKGPFLAMPSHKLADRCPGCGRKNHFLANYCHHCGRRLPAHREIPVVGGRPRLFADIVFPVCAEFRTYLEGEVLAAYERARQEQPQAPEPHPTVHAFGAGIITEERDSA